MTKDQSDPQADGGSSRHGSLPSDPGQEHSLTTCFACKGVVGWIDSPTGGWWAHEQHPADGHDAGPAYSGCMSTPPLPIDGPLLRNCVVSPQDEHALHRNKQGETWTTRESEDWTALVYSTLRSGAPPAQSVAPLEILRVNGDGVHTHNPHGHKTIAVQVEVAGQGDRTLMMTADVASALYAATCEE